MTPTLHLNEIMYIVTGLSSFAAVTFLTLWRIAHNEARHAHNQNVKAAKIIDELRKENKRLDGLLTSANRSLAVLNGEYFALDMEISELKAKLSTALIRNERGQLVRADGKPTDPKRVARREREKAKKLERMTDLMLQASGSSVASEKVERKLHQLEDGMQVKDLTNDKRREIHKACVENGVSVDELKNLFDIDHPWIWSRYGIVHAAKAIDNSFDINIPFTEFMARIKGEWVDPKSNPSNQLPNGPTD